MAETRIDCDIHPAVGGNVLYGTQAVYDPYMAAAFCKAINDWIAEDNYVIVET